MKFKYCPYCGEKAVQKEIGDEGLMAYCENCRQPLWDMFSTCVICAVVNEYGEIALLRQDYISKETYVCVSGYIKLSETAEETAVREIKEELGLDVLTLKYIKSYILEIKSTAPI